MQKETKLFSNYMLQVHDMTLEEQQLAWESIAFSHEELDEQVVPVAGLHGLPNPLTISCSTYGDEFGSQWMFGLAHGEEIDIWLYAWIVKDGEIVDRNIPLRGGEDGKSQV